MIEAVRYPVTFYTYRRPENIDSKVFYVARPYRVEYREDGKWKDYEIEAHFGTDFSSVPRLWRWLVSVLDAIEESCIHDHACRKKTMPRKKADEFFVVAMKCGKKAWWKRNVMYGGVSLFTFWKSLWGDA